ncbi:MAG: bifunctional 5,10-methylene-tetrahydrofolate dehydrogenase/5,10-methylene-tetrahydrofolate cyclohydrolase [Caldiserica bacterium]|jgi:methylenetetrahydrofolate dehydrogenase (NADP+)/methenyltetrahydrofolate cyclohydrolase|nr:bifunctional 5,10-methylene-tetrahydrofolate dehydrogenase/5,10-methylene-tetrahydrofolate cyclohydrolase [Caldisericota bacterium]MDH7563100.1 tetrahydrofolate dehydrogenase/cyclohydrolase catalytic domain-containing protein [Caldisericota bacterium]
MAQILRGADVVNSLRERISREVLQLKELGVFPALAIVRLGKNPDDIAYEKGAIKRCEGMGITCFPHEFPQDLPQEELIRELERLSFDHKVHGIIVFRPLPAHISEKQVKFSLDPSKDVDCFHPVNVARVFEGDESGFPPCTPQAVLEILDHYGIELQGKRVTIIGRSQVVGRPLAMMLLKRNATITICHTKTVGLPEISREADILIAACGKPRIVNSSFLNPRQIVIDVGINVDERGNICGDVNFEEAEKIVSGITPVPGGVGTVTTSVLASNVVKAARLSLNKR